MKKIIIIFITLFGVLFLTGCSNKDLIKAYNNMKTSDELNGYSMDLRIYGTVKDISYNEIVRISNYKDAKFLITETNIENENTVEKDELKTYVINNKIYQKKDLEYKEISSYKYTDPLIYLEGLKNITRTISKGNELIDDEEYLVCKARVKKKVLKKILEEINIDETIEGDEIFTVYMNAEERVHRIVYKIKKLTIDINYFGINSANDIQLPNKTT